MPPQTRPDTTNADDAALIARSHTEPDTFVTLFDRYHAEIHRYARSRLGPAAADDLASETFLIAFRKRATFDPTTGTGQVRSWLYGITTNLIHRHHRDEERRLRATARAAPHQPPHPGHDDQVLIRLNAETARGPLAAALAALPTRDRDVLLLNALGDLDHHEIATALDIPYGTVCSRLNRARRKIRATLDFDPADLD